MKTLREACIERGVDPDNTGVNSTKQRWINLDRIIPGVPDRISPSQQLAALGRSAHAQSNARRMYTRTSAANDRSFIEREREFNERNGIAAYIAVFCRLNNLKEGV